VTPNPPSDCRDRPKSIGVQEPLRPRKSRLRVVRWAYAGLGLISVGLGALGIFVPGMPTTIFLIIALWSFARSSDRLHDWLFYHPRFGPFLSNWSRYGIMSRKAKWYAGLSIIVSYFLTVVIARNFVFSLVIGAILAGVTIYIITRPETPPPEQLEP
jgi:uncharacterized protein